MACEQEKALLEEANENWKEADNKLEEAKEEYEEAGDDVRRTEMDINRCVSDYYKTYDIGGLEIPRECIIELLDWLEAGTNFEEAEKRKYEAKVNNRLAWDFLGERLDDFCWCKSL